MARLARVVVPEFRGWVDKVEWSGSAPEVTPPAPPSTWTEVGYSYDPAGRRIEKKYDGTTVVKYLYDGGHCLAEYDGNNNLLRTYIYGPCVDEPISMIDVEHSNATYYYHFDGLGSVVALTNASGTTAVLYEYSVYGQVAASDPKHPNRFMFTGREFDKDTGLYYYRARYYNPEIGRFLQTDPVGYTVGVNLYTYCGNNPLNYVDPSGGEFWGALIGGTIGGAIGGISGGWRGGWIGAVSGTVGGAITGAMIGFGCDPVTSGAVGGGAGAVTNAAINQLIFGNVSPFEATVQVVASGFGGAVWASYFPGGDVATGIGVGLVSGATSIVMTAATNAYERMAPMFRRWIRLWQVDNEGFPPLEAAATTDGGRVVDVLRELIRRSGQEKASAK